MIIIPGPSSQELGRKIAELLKTKTVTLHHKRFPDGESYIRLENNIKNENVAIIQTTSPPQDTNLMQLCLIADATRTHGAKQIIAVIPYLAYARQDKQFLPGEAVSIKTIANMLSANGVTQLITVNIHAEQALKNFNITTKNLSAIPLLAKYFEKRGYTGAFAIAPDEGAKKHAIEAAKILKGEYGWLHKERDRHTGQITVEKKKLNVKNKDVIIFDDIISTGGTIVNAVKILKDQGARRIFAACVHPLLMNGAQNKIIQSGAEEIVGTDCVPSPVSKVSVAPLIADALKTLEE